MEVAVLAVSPSAQAPDEVENKAVKQIRDENNGENFGKPVPKDQDEVVVPIPFDKVQNGFRSILRGHIQKVHDYNVSLSGSIDQNALDVDKMQFRPSRGVEARLRGRYGG